MTACTVIGLGEAGATYAAALTAAGHKVTGFDPVAPSTPAGVTRAATAAEACAGADIVLVLTGAAAARSVAQECLPVLPAGSCYADFTSPPRASCANSASCPAKQTSPTSPSSDPFPPRARRHP